MIHTTSFTSKSKYSSDTRRCIIVFFELVISSAYRCVYNRCFDILSKKPIAPPQDIHCAFPQVLPKDFNLCSK